MIKGSLPRTFNHLKSKAPKRTQIHVGSETINCIFPKSEFSNIVRIANGPGVKLVPVSN